MTNKLEYGKIYSTNIRKSMTEKVLYLGKIVKKGKRIRHVFIRPKFFYGFWVSFEAYVNEGSLNGENITFGRCWSRPFRSKEREYVSGLLEKKLSLKSS